MWTVTLVKDPLPLQGRTDLSSDSSAVVVDSFVARAGCSYDQLCSSSQGSNNNTDLLLQVVLEDGGQVASVALADYIARRLCSINDDHDDDIQCLTFQEKKRDGCVLEYSLEPLDHLTSSIISSRLALNRRRQQQLRAAQNINNGKNGISNGNGNKNSQPQQPPPYVLERTDIWCCNKEAKLHVDLRLLIHEISDTDEVMQEQDENEKSIKAVSSLETTMLITAATVAVASMLKKFTEIALLQQKSSQRLFHHIATVVLQDRLRGQLMNKLQAVAFCANNAILPRKSGASQAPMASPPAVPFMAPTDSDMHHTVLVDMGRLAPFVNITTNGTADFASMAQQPRLVNGQHATSPSAPSPTASTVISLVGLLIPRGVTLIVGGGYHGKSTLLRAIAAGVYNKIPGDGREFCVAIQDAISVRAEDGRYVNNCNVSAFISNLPSPPPFALEMPSPQGVMPEKEKKTIKTDHSISAMLAKEASAANKPTNGEKETPPSSLDTTHFSTGEASGSTSQAANVVEAVEMGCKAFLVDEDVSAANFMARDGRMRSLVMDESITPLLYRVNGLYNSIHGISSIVVVGGVGDWLDVPDKVILMDRYLCKDATAKARSISRQFSHGHVQYGGRGVVHRLEWPRSGTPIPRRPTNTSASCLNFQNTSIALMDGGHGLHLHVSDEQPQQQTTTGDVKNVGMAGGNGDNTDDSGDEERFIDLSRCEQLLGRKPQLYGCGMCALLLLEMSKQYPDLGLAGLLAKMDDDLNDQGFASLLLPSLSSPSEASSLSLDSGSSSSSNWNLLVESLGCAYRPRRFEVGQAVCRLRGITFEELPIPDDDGSEAAAMAEEERKRKELLDMWNARRKNKLHDSSSSPMESSSSSS